MTFELPPLSKVDAVKGGKFVGKSSANYINYAVIIPGAVLQQGYLPVKGGRFEYNFDPEALNDIAATYDTTNTNSGKAELGDVVHITFFSKEQTADGNAYHSFVRLIVRGTTVHYTR
jgi:hypothetical protein